MKEQCLVNSSGGRSLPVQVGNLFRLAEIPLWHNYSADAIINRLPARLTGWLRSLLHQLHLL